MRSALLRRFGRSFRGAALSKHGDLSGLRARRLRLEQLEERTLLSIGGIGHEQELLSQPWKFESASSAESRLGSSIDWLPAPDVAGPSWVDEGDSYWADGREIALWRSMDQVVVGLEASANPELFSTQLAAADASLAELMIETSLDSDSLTLSSASGSIGNLEATLDDLTKLTTVSWAAPTFINSETGGRQWLADEIVVALQPGSDPHSFLTTDTYSSYRPLLGTADQFVATVAGGALAALDVANALHDAPNIAWASPNFYYRAKRPPLL